MSSSAKKNFTKMSVISGEVVKAGGCVQEHPLGF